MKMLQIPGLTCVTGRQGNHDLIYLIYYKHDSLIVVNCQTENNWDRSWLWRCRINIWITDFYLPWWSRAKNTGCIPPASSLHPPAWPNIYIWGSVIIPQAAPQPPELLGGNSKKTHNGIYLLCLPSPRVDPGDYKSSYNPGHHHHH